MSTLSRVSKLPACTKTLPLVNVHGGISCHGVTGDKPVELLWPLRVLLEVSQHPLEQVYKSINSL